MENPFKFIKRRNERMRHLKEETGMTLIERARTSQMMSKAPKDIPEKTLSRQEQDALKRLKRNEERPKR